MTGREPTVIARTVARVVVPLILVTAFTLLLQGHNLPGGGFIAGVLTATAFALTYIIYGLDYVRTELFGVRVESADAVEARLARDLGPVFGVGLLVAAGSGVAAMALGAPFLTQAVRFVEHLPLYGEIELASALVFDLGVYLVVVGALLTVLAVVGLE